MEGALSVGLLFRNFRGRILVTWLLVLLENILWALVPLFIGRAIAAWGWPLSARWPRSF